METTSVAQERDRGWPQRVQVLERGWLSANSIVFKGREQTAVVDTGYVSHSLQTVSLIEAELGGRTLDRVLTTHLHSDHCGGNAALQARYPASETLIPPGEAEAVRRWDMNALSFEATGQSCPRFEFHGLLVPGEDIMLGDLSWQVHAAPGHDPHSIILFEPHSMTLISADALWQAGFGVVFPELAGEPSFEEVSATLDLIERLQPRRVIPGHGSVFLDVADALEIARRRLDSFAQDPAKHAWHAVKVLAKFKLLEVQAMATDEWALWLRETPYLDTIRRRFDLASSAELLGNEILRSLVRAGAVSVDQGGVRNC